MVGVDKADSHALLYCLVLVHMTLTLHSTGPWIIAGTFDFY